MSNTELIDRLSSQWDALDPVDEWRLDITEAIRTIEAQARELADAVETILAADAKIDEQAREIERTTNNRDMWKAQCAMQAAQIEAMRVSLSDCVEDSEEVLAKHLQAYGEKYRVGRLNHQREQISTARALLAGKAVTP